MTVPSPKPAVTSPRTGTVRGCSGFLSTSAAAMLSRVPAALCSLMAEERRNADGFHLHRTQTSWLAPAAVLAHPLGAEGPALASCGALTWSHLEPALLAQATFCSHKGWEGFQIPEWWYPQGKDQQCLLDQEKNPLSKVSSTKNTPENHIQEAATSPFMTVFIFRHFIG